MEVKILSTTIQTVEQVTTENAQYDCVVKRKNGAVTAVTATVNAIDSIDGEVVLRQLGQLNYNGNISFGANGFPATTLTSTYIAEFTEYIDLINKRI